MSVGSRQRNEKKINTHKLCVLVFFYTPIWPYGDLSSSFSFLCSPIKIRIHIDSQYARVHINNGDDDGCQPKQQSLISYT